VTFITFAALVVKPNDAHAGHYIHGAVLVIVVGYSPPDQVRQHRRRFCRSKHKRQAGHAWFSPKFTQQCAHRPGRAGAWIAPASDGLRSGLHLDHGSGAT